MRLKLKKHHHSFFKEHILSQVMKNSSEEIALYVSTTPTYDSSTLRAGLSQYDFELVQSLVTHIRRQALPANGIHFGRIADDLLAHYGGDSIRKIDEQVAELERLLPQKSLDAVIQKEEQAVNASVKIALDELRESI